MSGQPLQKPLDATKFRQQYLANLELQTKIDDMNYQANKVYVKTGAPQQPTDQRTLEEKFRDTIGLKVEIRSMLKEITTGEQAQQIVNELSALEVMYCYSHLPQLIKILKPKYKGGVPAYVFLHTFRRFVDDEVKNRAIFEGTPQQTNSSQMVSTMKSMTPNVFYGDNGNTSLRGGITTKEQLGILLELVKKIIKEFSSYRLDKRAERLLTGLIEVIPSIDQIQYIRQGQYTDDPSERQQIIELLNRLTEDIPNYNMVNMVINRGQSIQGIDQAEIFLREVSQLCADVDRIDEEAAALGRMLEYAERQKQEGSIVQSTGGGERSALLSNDYLANLSLKAESELPDINDDDIESIFDAGVGVFYISPADAAEIKKGDLIKYFKVLEEESIKNGGQQIFGRKVGEGRTTITGKKGKDAILDFLKKYDAEIRGFMGAEMPPSAEVSYAGGGDDVPEADAEVIAGVGLKKKMGRPRTRSVQGKGLRRSDHLLPTDVDRTAGIPPAARFMPMGKLIINRNKLAEGIISVKTSGGGFVKEFKSKKVSHNLANVIRKITGGSVLGYSDFDKMSQPEKDYLHSLSKRASILDKIDIPAPRIDNDERDIRQFEIMKGEMMAGNNNEQMIRKFKQMIVKLLDKGILPKGEGRDILVELTKAGF
jgi:hypothetical protein